MRARALCAIAGVVAWAAAWGACGADGGRSAESTSAPRARSSPPRLIASNALRADYAGSTACIACHRELSQGFERSPMHRMTTRIEDAEVGAPFAGEALRYRAQTVTMETVDRRRYVRLEGMREHDGLYRVTKVIGGRRREDFAGVRVTGTGPDAAAARREEILPVSWVIATDEWRYKGYSVMTAERPYVRAGPEWSRTCILCHNTAPHLVSLYDDLVGERAPKYQGSLHGNLLPAGRRWELDVRDERAVGEAVREELVLLGDDVATGSMSLQTVLVHAMDVTWRRFDAEHLVEIGIGCEACHNGSAEHVADPSALPAFELRGPIALGPQGARQAGEAAWINRTCARCHSVLFSDYPNTWEGGDRDGSPGGAHINSGEGRDFLLGGCADALACTRCHDAHAEDSEASLARIASPAGNALCVECHAELAGDDAFRAHAHHAPEGAAGACVSCHMPRKNMGLGYGLTRYHRIGSPTEPARVERDRPLECALCHADRSVASLVGQMEAWWGTRYDREALVALYGDLDANPIDATLARGEPHEVAVAVAVAAEAGDRRRIQAVAAQLENEIPLVRYFARESLAELAGARPDLDMNLPATDLADAGRRWLRERR